MASFNARKNSLIPVFVLLFFSIVHCNEAYNFFISRIYLSQTCPSYAGCSGGYLNTIDTCCVQCSCNSTCIESHTCCPESQYASATPIPYRSEDPRFACRNTLLIGNPRSIYVYPEYEFIDSCPDTSDDRILEEFCERIVLTNRSGIVADNTPVLDKSTGISYGNIYCARCNNIDVANLEAWQPKLVCNKNFDLRTESYGQENALERLIEYNRCDVSFEPPPSSNDTKHCFADVIDACNVTGAWTTYNQLDKYHCRHLDLLYVSVYPPQNKYKNIFCALCNGENVYVFSNSLCPFPTNQNTNSMTMLLGFTVGEIGIQASQSELRQSSRDSCPPLFKHDPFTGACRPLYCSPPYHVDVSTSTCKLFHRYIENGLIVHPYKLIFETILNVREARNISVTIIVRFDEDPDIRTCDARAFYQTDLNERDFSSNNFTSSTTNVSSIYLLVYSRIAKGNPREEYDRRAIQYYHHLSLKNVVPLDSTYFDPGMLLMYDQEEELDLIRLDYEENFSSNLDGTPSHFIFNNPYDNTMILGPTEYTRRWLCQPRLYEKDFLPCLSFLYESTSLFRRTQEGLMIEFESSSLVFNFGEFKSVNQTTVRICSDSVMTKVKTVSSSGMVSSVDCSVLGVVLVFILFM